MGALTHAGLIRFLVFFVIDLKSERHLRWVIGEYVKDYHLERNHQGLGNDLTEPIDELEQGRVGCRERLGGLLRYYYRRAA